MLTESFWVSNTGLVFEVESKSWLAMFFDPFVGAKKGFLLNRVVLINC